MPSWVPRFRTLSYELGRNCAQLSVKNLVTPTTAYSMGNLAALVGCVLTSIETGTLSQPTVKLLVAVLHDLPHDTPYAEEVASYLPLLGAMVGMSVPDLLMHRQLIDLHRSDTPN